MEAYVAGHGESALNDIDSWDDTEILKVFDNAIKSHRVKKNAATTKTDTPEKVVSTKDQLKVAGVPGPWETVEKSQEKIHRLDQSQRNVHFSKEHVDDIRRELETNEDLYNEDAYAAGQAGDYYQWYNQQGGGGTAWPSQPMHQQQFMFPAPANSQDASLEDEEQAALSELLLSWYQCGFAAAKYQMLLDRRKKITPQDTNNCNTNSNSSRDNSKK